MMAVVTSALTFGSLAQAKSVDFTPDITSDSYWDTHHIARVRVVELGNDTTGRETLTWSVIETISETPLPSSQTVPLNFLWYGPDVEEPPKHVPNEELVIYHAKEGPSAIVVTLLRPGTGGERVLDQLRTIAGLRRDVGGPNALREAAFHAEPPVAHYALKRQVTKPEADVPPGYADRLLALRDEAARNVYVRLLASQLANNLADTPNSDAEYQWVQEAILRDPGADWKDVAPFFHRLLEFEGKRGDTADFTTREVGDPTQAQAIRIAGYSVFDDPKLFFYGAPDATSNQIFDACLAMLRDEDPVIRQAGAALLSNISSKIDPQRRTTYQDRGKKGLTTALATEQDPATRFHLERFVAMFP